MSITIWRSKRPGRSSAGSRMSGRLVAAITTTPASPPKPSISTSSWLSVCSRSSLPWPMPAPRLRPAASTSSMKMIAGAILRALANRSRTRAAPTPTSDSTNSAPETEKKAASASPAVARASSVLPVPGGPTSSTPLGGAAPRSRNLAGSARKSRISRSSTTASPAPATSSNVSAFVTLAPRLRPLPLKLENEAMPPAPPSAPSRVNSANRQTSSRIGIRNCTRIALTGLPACWSTVTTAPLSLSVRNSDVVCASELGYAAHSVRPSALWTTARESSSSSVALTICLLARSARSASRAATSWPGDDGFVSPSSVKNSDRQDRPTRRSGTARGGP